MSIRVESSRLLFRDSTSKLGGALTLAGLIRDSQGVGGMRVYGSYALVYVAAGGGSYRDALGRRTRIGAGDCILVFPELAHNYGPDKGDFWDEIHICFTGPIFDTLRGEGLLNPHSPISHREPIGPWLNQLTEFAEQPRPLTHAANLTQLAQWCALLAELVALPTDGTAEMEWLALAKSLLSANLEREADFAHIAKTCGFSYETFRKTFARHAGMSPNRYRTQARFEAAKTLILRGELTHAAIAGSLGFRDEFHFSKRFKELSGLSPREFRQQNIGKEKASTRGE